MPPCAATNCTSTLPSASEVAGEPDHAVNPEVVVTICFGLVMFLLALLALWQGQKQLRRTALKRTQRCCWPRPLNATVHEAIDRVPNPRSHIGSNNYLNGKPFSRADDVESLLIMLVVFIDQIESQSRVTQLMPLPPVPTHSSETYLQPPAPIHARQMAPIPSNCGLIQAPLDIRGISYESG